MPAPINESIKRRVIQQWLSGESRDKIAADNNIGADSVTSVVSYHKIGLEDLDFDSIRELALEVRKEGLNWSDLASHFRLYNYFRKSGASEEKVESFITMANSSDLPPEKVIELVNQLFEISKDESIPLHEVPCYITQKLEEKQKIEEERIEADKLFSKFCFLCFEVKSNRSIFHLILYLL